MKLKAGVKTKGLLCNIDQDWGLTGLAEVEGAIEVTVKGKWVIWLENASQTEPMTRAQVGKNYSFSMYNKQGFLFQWQNEHFTLVYCYCWDSEGEKSVWETVFKGVLLKIYTYRMYTGYHL